MIDVVFDADVNHAGFPATADIERAVRSVCDKAGFSGQPELCVRFATDEDIQALNKQWRELDKVTDVLSFPMQEGPNYDLNMSLGDIALAARFVRQQASSLDLPMQAHTLHLIIHAVLHLLGFDHVKNEDAIIMQKLEQRIMRHLGLHDPYPNHSTAELS
jgi:probable rRNA maturation factor